MTGIWKGIQLTPEWSQNKADLKQGTSAAANMAGDSKLEKDVKEDNKNKDKPLCKFYVKSKCRHNSLLFKW